MYLHEDFNTSLDAQENKTGPPEVGAVTKAQKAQFLKYA